MPSSSAKSDAEQLKEYRELLKTLRGDLHKREARAVLRLTRSFCSGYVDKKDAETEKSIMRSQSYRGLTKRLADENASLLKELKEIDKSGKDPETDLPDNHSGYGIKTRSQVIKARLPENDDRQDAAIDDFEHFIEEEERALEAEEE